MKSQSGFTLIELVTVILVLGILATVAVPIYIDFRSRAALANVEGVGAALSSASYMNWDAKLISAKHQKATDCSTAQNLLDLIPATNAALKAPLGFHYDFGPSATLSTDGATVSCDVTIINDVDSTISRKFSYAYKVTTTSSNGI